MVKIFVVDFGPGRFHRCPIDDKLPIRTLARAAAVLLALTLTTSGLHRCGSLGSCFCERLGPRHNITKVAPNAASSSYCFLR